MNLMLKNLLHGLCDLIYPNNCLICKGYLRTSQAALLCPSCRDTLEFNHPPFCLRCSRHLGVQPQSLCAECSGADYHFDRAWAITIYNDTMKRLIHLFKYGQKISLRKYFAELIFSFVETYHIDLRQFDIVVPVPLSSARLRERGYNQSQLLSEGVCQQFSLRLCQENLLRVRHTQNQALLGKKERWTNIRGAFTIRNSLPFLDKSVLLVDDLLTTGATASEAACILKEAGAKRVDVLALAIAC